VANVSAVISLDAGIKSVLEPFRESASIHPNIDERIGHVARSLRAKSGSGGAGASQSGEADDSPIAQKATRATS